MASFPVLGGVQTLTLLVDHDRNGTGQEAAAECARRWIEAGRVEAERDEAGREVIRLTPRELGADFNDIIMGKRHEQ